MSADIDQLATRLRHQQAAMVRRSCVPAADPEAMKARRLEQARESARRRRAFLRGAEAGLLRPEGRPDTLKASPDAVHLLCRAFAHAPKLPESEVQQVLL